MRRGLVAGAGTFVLATLLVLPSVSIIEHAPLYIAFPILLLIILVGVVFDVVGVAVAVADDTPFHARAAKRLPGARQALWLVRNADRVSNFCNDVVGDVSGTISGAAAAVVVVQLVAFLRVGPRGRDLVNVGLIALVASITVGGKAAGKLLAMSQPHWVVWRVAVVLHWVDSALLNIWSSREGRKGKRGKA